MSEVGMVVGLHGDQAVVELEASKECEACGACRYTSTGRMLTTINNTLQAQVGDSVKIDIEPHLVVTAAAIVYILPIALFFIGYAAFFGWAILSAPTVKQPGSSGPQYPLSPPFL